MGMDAMAKGNLEKTDERKAQYDAESDAQRHRNVDGKAMNAMKICDLRAANEKKSAAMRIDNEAEIVEMRRLGAEGDAEHSAWMDDLRVKNKQKMAKMESDGQRALSGMKMRVRGSECVARRGYGEDRAKAPKRSERGATKQGR